MIRPNPCPEAIRSGATWRLRRLRYEQPPGRRQVIRRHVIIEQALASDGAVDALGDTKCDRAAEHWPTAVAGNAMGPFDGHPIGRTGAAAQLSRWRIIGKLDGRATVT